MGKILILSAAVAMMSALSACNTSSCIENQSSLPMAGLYAAGSGSSISVTSMVDQFDLKQVSRAVMKLFEDYNYKIYVSKHYKGNRSYFKLQFCDCHYEKSEILLKIFHPFIFLQEFHQKQT